MPPLDPARTIRELEELRRLSGDERGAQRVAFTPTWSRARAWLRERFAGLPVEMHDDAAGNFWATLAGASEQTVIVAATSTRCPTAAGSTAASIRSPASR